MERDSVIPTFSGYDVNSPPKALVEVRKLQGQYLAGEIRYYLGKYRPKLDGNYYNKAKGEIPFDEDKRKIALDRLTEAQLLLLYSDCAETSSDMLVSTFNCSALLGDMGFSIEYEQKIESLSSTLSVGIDKTPFPVDCKKFVKFTRNSEAFYCPIVNGMINTNYMRVSGLKNVMFVSEIVECTSALATFFEFKNGATVAIQAGEAGTELLNFDHFMSPNYKSAIGFTVLTLSEWIMAIPCNDKRGWKGVSYTGPKFAHVLYNAIANKMMTDVSFPGIFKEIMNKLFAGSVVNGKFMPFLGIDKNKFVITRKQMSIPESLGSVRMDLRKHEANLDQAYMALMYGRSFRGTDATERGALSRTAYFACNVSVPIAEVSYLMTNLKRYIGLYKTILLNVDSSTSGNAISNFLEALVGLDFDGDIYIPDNSHVVSTLKLDLNNKKRNKVGTFSGGKFRVVTMIDVSAYMSRGSWFFKSEDYVVPGEDAIIYDWRPLNIGLTDKKKISRAEEIIEADLEARMHQWENWSYPVISRGSLFMNLFSQKYKAISVASAVELHDLVMWLGYNIDLNVKPTWWYRVDSSTVSEVCAASIVCNFTRCMRYVTGVSPFMLLAFLKFKVPLVSVAGLRRAQLSGTQYSIIAEALATIESGGDLAAMYREASAYGRTAMLSNQDIVQHLIGDDDRGKQVITTDTRNEHVDMTGLFDVEIPVDESEGSSSKD